MCPGKLKVGCFRQVNGTRFNAQPLGHLIMKYKNFILLILTFHLYVVSYFFSCTTTTSSEEIWEFIGRRIVGIDSVSAILPGSDIVYTDTVRSVDTLSLRINSHSINGDKFENDTLIVVRNLNGIDLTLYADIYKWIGSGVMPPTNLWPTGLSGNRLCLPPPFPLGNFISTLHQPDGNVKLDTIVVIE